LNAEKSIVGASTSRGYGTVELVRRLLAVAWKYRVDGFLSLGLSVLLLVLGLVGLQLLGIVIDVIRHALDPSQRAPSYPLGWAPPAGWSAQQIVAALSLAIVVQALLRAVLTYSYNMSIARLTQGKIVPALRDQLYDKLQRLSFRFFDVNGSSSLFNRVTGDVQNTRLFVDGVILQGLNMCLTLAAYFVFMWRIHAGLTVACLAVTPALWVLMHFYSARLRPGYLRNRELYDDLVQCFTEGIHGMQTVKGFAAEAHQISRFEARNRLVSDQQRRIFWDLSIFTPTTQLLSQLSLAVLFAYGGWLYVVHRLPLGSGLVVFAGLLQQFTGQVANLSTIANSLQQSLTAARRVFEVLDTPIEVQSRPSAHRPGRLTGRIEFEDVTFGYTEGVPALRGVSFLAAPGQLIGLFGPTGSGKSTLLSLIARFYDPHRGRILVDGVDLRELDLDAYRRQIGLVYQESFLFSNTVAANIAFGNPQATQAQIERAARLASAQEFIQELPHGYETVLGESGADLSGGQRQRLALARALLREPPILLLDDPTASVDPKTEHEILSSLTQAMKARTTFLVSNRLSILRHSNFILVLDQGKIIQRGRHEELMRSPGLYRQTATLQFADLGRNGDFAS
jgi:ABC-type multidrug transport system fused ATPase/permease subunit